MSNVTLMMLALQVSVKHSGSLFMYAGCEGGAYAKNSFGNMYVIYSYIRNHFKANEDIRF